MIENLICFGVCTVVYIIMFYAFMEYDSRIYANGNDVALWKRGILVFIFAIITASVIGSIVFFVLTIKSIF